MSSLNQSQLERYTLINVSDLLPLLNQTEIQRVISQERVDEIYTSMLSVYKQGKVIVCPGTLIVADLNNVKYLIDGQHRFQALIKIFNETKHDQSVVINTIQVSSEEGLIDLFNLINNTVPVAEIPKGVSRKDSNDIIRYFTENYASIFSYSAGGGAQRPRIHHTKFQQQVNRLMEIYPHDLLERLIALNDNLKQMGLEHFRVKKGDTIPKIKKIVAKAIDSGLYFGVFPSFECFNSLYDKHFVRTRTGISKLLRDKIWLMHFGKNDKGECPWCEKEITCSTCHMAHDLSYADGGEETVDNLYPCCASCNLSMGTLTYDQVKEKLARKISK